MKTTLAANDGPREKTATIYEFASFRVDTSRRLLLQRGEAVPLPPKTFQTLLVLLDGAGRVVGKREIMDRVWPDSAVEENNLNQHIAALRRALDDPRGSNRYIVTEPGLGYRFVGEVVENSATPTASARRLMLAVLPFEDLNAEPGHDHIADGLAEDTIAAVGLVAPAHFGVVSRASVMPYKNARDGAARIGAELGVDYLLVGSLRTDGERTRITASLVRVADHAQTWSASFDSGPAHMLAFQRELAETIAQQVRMHLDPAQLATIGQRHPRNAEAFDAYWRGRHLWHQLTPMTTRQALECYARATALDPGYALAWSGIADALAAGPITADVCPATVVDKARAAAAQALRANVDLAEVQASVGFVRFWLEWDWSGAEAAFRRAIELDPNYSFSYRMLGLTCMHLGRHQEALQQMRRCREIDPLLPVHHALSAQAAFGARQYPLALQFARQSLVLDPDFWVGHFHVAQTSIELGDFDTARQALIAGARKSGGISKIVALRGYLDAREGRIDDARQVIGLLSALSAERYVPASGLALVYAGLGEADDAALWLERAADQRDVHLMFVPVDAKWDAIRSHPRIAAAAARTGLPQPR